MSFKNKDILDITLHALLGEMIYRSDRHQRLDLRLRIDDRDIRIVSDYKHTVYDILDSETGELIAIQPSEDFMRELDTEWLNKESETYIW